MSPSFPSDHHKPCRATNQNAGQWVHDAIYGSRHTLGGSGRMKRSPHSTADTRKKGESWLSVRFGQFSPTLCPTGHPVTNHRSVLPWSLLVPLLGPRSFTATHFVFEHVCIRSASASASATRIVYYPLCHLSLDSWTGPQVRILRSLCCALVL